MASLFTLNRLDPVATVKDLGICDEAGWIVTDQHMKTAIAGIYAIECSSERPTPNHHSRWNGTVAGQEVYSYITEH